MRLFNRNIRSSLIDPRTGNEELSDAEKSLLDTMLYPSGRDKYSRAAPAARADFPPLPDLLKNIIFNVACVEDKSGRNNNLVVGRIYRKALVNYTDIAFDPLLVHSYEVRGLSLVAGLVEGFSQHLNDETVIRYQLEHKGSVLANKFTYARIVPASLKAVIKNMGENYEEAVIHNRINLLG